MLILINILLKLKKIRTLLTHKCSVMILLYLQHFFVDHLFGTKVVKYVMHEVIFTMEEK